MSIWSVIGLGSYLPCALLSRQPYVLAAYERDFLSHLDAYEAALPRDVPITLFIQLGWQCQTEAAATRLSQKFRAARQRLPQLSRVLFLANCPEEEAALTRQGEEVVFCHQNAFLDERRYPILSFVRKRYDAIYIARIAPFKRHALATAVRSLRLIGTFADYDRDYVDTTLRSLPQAKLTGPRSSAVDCVSINRARCGLCLSAEEGAMFVSAEYLLCGLPAVNTANVGGRDLVMPDFATVKVPDDPAAVAAAVDAFAAHAPPAADIRAATLELMRPHRETMLTLLHEAGVSDELCARYARRFPHKLGLRCGYSPWRNRALGLPRPKGYETPGAPGAEPGLYVSAQSLLRFAAVGMVDGGCRVLSAYPAVRSKTTGQIANPVQSYPTKQQPIKISVHLCPSVVKMVVGGIHPGIFAACQARLAIFRIRFPSSESGQEAPARTPMVWQDDVSQSLVSSQVAVAGLKWRTMLAWRSSGDCRKKASACSAASR